MLTRVKTILFFISTGSFCYEICILIHCVCQILCETKVFCFLRGVVLGLGWVCLSCPLQMSYMLSAGVEAPPISSTPPLPDIFHEYQNMKDIFHEYQNMNNCKHELLSQHYVQSCNLKSPKLKVWLAVTKTILFNINGEIVWGKVKVV